MSHSYKASPRKCWSQQFWKHIITPLLLEKPVSAAAECISASKTWEKSDCSDANLGNYPTFWLCADYLVISINFSHNTLRFWLELMNPANKNQDQSPNFCLFCFISSIGTPHDRQPASHSHSWAGLQPYCQSFSATATLPLLQHLNPAKLKAFIRLDSMTDELVFQAKLILKMKQKQGPDEAWKKPLCCRMSSLSASETNLFCWLNFMHIWFCSRNFSVSAAEFRFQMQPHISGIIYHHVLIWLPHTHIS